MAAENGGTAENGADAHGPAANARPASSLAACRICTIRLEQICYRRAWWFRAFREVLATGIRLFAVASRIPRDAGVARSPMCRKCLRFRKNALKERSRLFNRLDGHLNPLFNRVRDSLLTPEELEDARRLAARAADPGFSEAGPRHGRPAMARPLLPPPPSNTGGTA